MPHYQFFIMVLIKKNFISELPFPILFSYMSKPLYRNSNEVDSSLFVFSRWCLMPLPGMLSLLKV